MDTLLAVGRDPLNWRAEDFGRRLVISRVPATPLVSALVQHRTCLNYVAAAYQLRQPLYVRSTLPSEFRCQPPGGFLRLLSSIDTFWRYRLTQDGASLIPPCLESSFKRGRYQPL